MFREKKFNKLKTIGLNELFNITFDDKLNTYDINYDIDIDEYTSNMTINQYNHFTIIKETILEPYIMLLNDIIVIHISEDFIKDFEFLYKKSKEYVFDIYQTSVPDIKTEEPIVMYHIFCISKKYNDTNYHSFLKTNDCDPKYIYLSLLYGPCLIINKRFNVINSMDKYNTKYKFIKTIGKGLIDISIKNLIKQIINVSNTLQETLPPHYLKIN